MVSNEQKSALTSSNSLLLDLLQYTQTCIEPLKHETVYRQFWVRSFCQTPHKLMNRVTATLTLTLTLTLTDTGGAVLTLMLGYRSLQSSEQRAI